MITQKVLTFKVERTNEKITAHAGLALYAEFLKRAGIKAAIEGKMHKPGSNRGYNAWEYILPALLMLQGGGRHIEDIRQIRDDEGLREIIGLKRMPSLSTYGDWFRRMGKFDSLYCFKSVITGVVKQFLKETKINEFTLWSDPTIIESDKADAMMTYKGEKGYRPIMTAFKEVPVIVYHEFREGNNHDGQLRAIEEAFKVLPEGKKIVHASLDSEYYQSSVINYLQDRGVGFCIAVVQDRAVKEAIKGIKVWRRYEDEDGIHRGREIGETVHVMNKSEKAFRLVVLRWKKPQIGLFDEDEWCYHAIATNLECSMEEVILKYNERGEMENIIKELKGGFGADYMPFGDFGANALWFSLQVLTYNTFIMQKELILPEAYKKVRIVTLRWRLIEIGAKVVYKSRQYRLKIYSAIQRYKEYLFIVERLLKIEVSVF